MDGFDLLLLRALQQDGRLTNQELGERVGLSPSQCSRRRAALEAQGVVRGYAALLDGKALGLGMLAFIEVTLNAHSHETARQFRDLVAGVDWIQDCYALTGDADYLLKAVLGGLDEFATLVNDVLLPHPSIAHLRSSIVFERVKESPALPLARLGPG